MFLDAGHSTVASKTAQNPEENVMEIRFKA